MKHADPEVLRRRSSPLFRLEHQVFLRAITMSPAAWGYAFQLGDPSLRKTVENRSHPRFAFLLGDWIAIHAGTFVYGEGQTLDLISKIAGIRRPMLSELPTRSIVALALVERMSSPGEGLESPWRFPDQYGYHFAEVIPLPAPIPAKGMQGAWRVKSPIREQVDQAFNAARRSLPPELPE